MSDSYDDVGGGEQAPEARPASMAWDIEIPEEIRTPSRVGGHQSRSRTRKTVSLQLSAEDRAATMVAKMEARQRRAEVNRSRSSTSRTRFCRKDQQRVGEAHQAKEELNELVSRTAQRKLDTKMHDVDRRRDAILDERVRAASRSASRNASRTASRSTSRTRSRAPSRAPSRALPRLRDIQDVSELKPMPVEKFYRPKPQREIPIAPWNVQHEPIMEEEVPEKPVIGRDIILDIPPTPMIPHQPDIAVANAAVVASAQIIRPEPVVDRVPVVTPVMDSVPATPIIPVMASEVMVPNVPLSPAKGEDEPEEPAGTPMLLREILAELPPARLHVTQSEWREPFRKDTERLPTRRGHPNAVRRVGSMEERMLGVIPERTSNSDNLLITHEEEACPDDMSSDFLPPSYSDEDLVLPATPRGASRMDPITPSPTLPEYEEPEGDEEEGSSEDEDDRNMEVPVSHVQCWGSDNVAGESIRVMVAGFEQEQLRRARGVSRKPKLYDLEEEVLLPEEDDSEFGFDQVIDLDSCPEQRVPRKQVPMVWKKRSDRPKAAKKRDQVFAYTTAGRESATPSPPGSLVAFLSPPPTAQSPELTLVQPFVASEDEAEPESQQPQSPDFTQVRPFLEAIPEEGEEEDDFPPQGRYLAPYKHTLVEPFRGEEAESPLAPDTPDVSTEVQQFVMDESDMDDADDDDDDDLITRRRKVVMGDEDEEDDDSSLAKCSMVAGNIVAVPRDDTLDLTAETSSEDEESEKDMLSVCDDFSEFEVEREIKRACGLAGPARMAQMNGAAMAGPTPQPKRHGLFCRMRKFLRKHVFGKFKKNKVNPRVIQIKPVPSGEAYDFSECSGPLEP